MLFSLMHGLCGKDVYIRCEDVKFGARPESGVESHSPGQYCELLPVITVFKPNDG